MLHLLVWEGKSVTCFKNGLLSTMLDMSQGVPLGATRDGRGQLGSGPEDGCGKQMVGITVLSSGRTTPLAWDPLSQGLLPEEMPQGHRTTTTRSVSRRRRHHKVKAQRCRLPQLF